MSKQQPNNSKYKQGKYIPKFPDKYIGDVTDIVYRSSWEKNFMRYCDLNPGVLKWASEMFKINYVDRKGHSHVYIPDFYLETVNVNDSSIINKFLVEIKPEKETREPIIPIGSITPKELKNIEYSAAVWQKNKYKWVYAEEWCKSRGIKFWIVTEENLNSFKP